MSKQKLRQLSVLSAFILLAVIPQCIPPMVEAEHMAIQQGRGKGIHVG